MEHLNGDRLMSYVRALADEIGPRPAGHPQEELAREYVRRVLAEHGLAPEDIESIPFPTPDTWGYMTTLPTLLTLMTNLPGRTGLLNRLTGGAIGVLSAVALWLGIGGQRQPLAFLTPRRPSATLVARLPARGEKRQTVVLVGHVDSNKQRVLFAPPVKRLLRWSGTASIAVVALNAVAQLLGLEKLRRLTILGLFGSLGILLADEVQDFVDGANDNASAVACLLGLGARLLAEPLEHTEVWLAFTGAEEVGDVGMHALLDAHGEALRDAYFLDYEMVGAGQLAYVSDHGLSAFNRYRPDAESVAWVEETARRFPEFGVTGQPMVIVEEVGSLRGRGFKGLCLAGVGQDGWLVNWHRYSDHSGNIEPAALEKAARFGSAMLQTLDGKA
jgi:hypothetical protein